MAGVEKKRKVLANVKIRFVQDWRTYRAGQIVDSLLSGLGKGPITELLRRGIVVYEGTESVAAYQTMTMQPVQTMVKRRGRPPGSKNKTKVL